MQKKLEEKLDILLKSAEDPVKLKKEIEIKLKEIEDVKGKMHEGIERVIREYTNHESGLIKLEAEKTFEDFKQSFNAAEGFDEIEKKTLAGQDAFFDFQGKLHDHVIAACNRQLIEITDKTSLSTATIIPRLSKDDFEKLKNDTATDKNAQKKEYYTTGACFWEETRSRSVYSMEKHINFLKKQILENLNKTKTLMVESLHGDVVKITAKYREKLKENMDKKNSEYTGLLHRMARVEDMLSEKKNTEDDLSVIKPSAERIQSIKGGIENVIS